MPETKPPANQQNASFCQKSSRSRSSRKKKRIKFNSLSPPSPLKIKTGLIMFQFFHILRHSVLKFKKIGYQSENLDTKISRISTNSRRKKRDFFRESGKKPVNFDKKSQKSGNFLKKSRKNAIFSKEKKKKNANFSKGQRKNGSLQDR